MATTSPEKTNPLAHCIVLPPKTAQQIDPKQRMIIGACDEAISPQRLGLAMLEVLRRPSFDPNRQTGKYIRPYIMVPRYATNDLSLSIEGQAAQHLSTTAFKLRASLEFQPPALLPDNNPPELSLPVLCRALLIASQHQEKQRSINQPLGALAIVIGHRDLLGMRASYAATASRETNIHLDKRTPQAEQPAVYELVTVSGLLKALDSSHKERERKIPNANVGDLVLWPITMSDIYKMSPLESNR